MITEKEKTCKERVRDHYKGRMKDLKKLWALSYSGDEKGDPDIGTLNEYGLSFDYVSPETFKEQEEGYFCYQLSTGGPGDEFRIYTNPDFSPHRIEYWFLDWFDGAKITLSGKAYAWFKGFFISEFVDSETCKVEFEEAMKS